MLNDDVLRLVFEECTLEACVALGDVCRVSSSMLAALDETLVMNKVQARVPWFQLGNQQCTSWTRCARVIVSRSRRALSGRHENLKVVDNLDEVVEGSFLDLVPVIPVDVSVDDSLRHNMKPLFPRAKLRNRAERSGSSITGTTLHDASIYAKYELTTLTAEAVDWDDVVSLSSWRREHKHRHPVATAPSGLQVRHRDGWELQVVAENANLLHVKCQVEGHAPGTCVEELVHKASQPRDEDGMLVIDPDLDAPRIPPYYTDPFGLFNLAPGSGGAFFLQHVPRDPQRCFLQYIEPTAERRATELCKLPCRDVSKAQILECGGHRFHVLYNGYVYLYSESMFHQLWVDLDSPAGPITVWNSEIPAMGPFGPQMCVKPESQIVRGDAQHGLDRFTTIESAASGCVVGDFQTGKTYYRHTNKCSSLTIPFVTEQKTVGFYVLDKKKWDFVKGVMSCLQRYGHEDRFHSAMARMFAEVKVQSQSTAEVALNEEELSQEQIQELLFELVEYAITRLEYRH